MTTTAGGVTLVSLALLPLASPFSPGEGQRHVLVLLGKALLTQLAVAIEDLVVHVEIVLNPGHASVNCQSNKRFFLYSCDCFLWADTGDVMMVNLEAQEEEDSITHQTNM
jgi:hypothetical protein